MNKSMRENCVLLSMDVKVLCPSLEWDDIVEAVKERITNSDMDVESVNWNLVGQIVPIMITEEGS